MKNQTFLLLVTLFFCGAVTIKTAKLLYDLETKVLTPEQSTIVADENPKQIKVVQLAKTN